MIILLHNLNSQYLNSRDASYYADKSWVGLKYLPLTGGTLTGPLIINPSVNPTNISFTQYGNLILNVSSNAVSAGIIFNRNVNSDFNGIAWNTSIGTRSITIEHNGYPGQFYIIDNSLNKRFISYDIPSKILYLGTNNEVIITPSLTNFTAPIKVNTISNYTAANGVLIEQVRIKTNTLSNTSNMVISTPALNMDACIGFGSISPLAKIDMMSYYINKEWNTLNTSERTSHIKLYRSSGAYMGFGVCQRTLNIVNDQPYNYNYIRFWQNQKNSFTMDASYNLNVNNGDIYITNPSTNPTVSLKSKTNRGSAMLYNASLNSMDFVFY